jgi:hypothetical protein
MANLTSGRQVSCGCYMLEAARAAGAASAVHGHARGAKSRTYVTWMAMIQRTTDPNSTAWPRYGGRGITVCNRWRNGANGKRPFECFLDDMGERPEGTSIDRWPNGQGNYEPGNCRWATRKQQANNLSSNKLTDKDAEDIRVARSAGEKSASIARRYGVHPQYVNEIIRHAKRAA